MPPIIMTLRDPLYKPARLDHRILLHGSVDEAGQDRFQKLRGQQGLLRLGQVGDHHRYQHLGVGGIEQDLVIL